ncbi:SCF ubiquitin ligase, Skp1 component [Handroanthus impetiginosus]|uniref:SKP1-like protein n=1 Tax=Handroanthus impetiginosus TaxID=429701 RepID=A0A2G9H197_9LAMI|nr:SCF ubiquitin ligase, Skp1 component [Handroanthus impetiginosus]
MASTSSNPLVTLRSSDGQEFIIPKSAAVLSGTIKNMLEEGFGDSVIPILNVDGKTLAKIIAYLNEHGSGNHMSDEKKKDFDGEFLSQQEITDLFEIVMAANFLNIKELMDTVCQKIADIMKNKSVKWVRKTFNIVNDFTPEEEQQIRDEHAWAWEDVEPDEDDDDIIQDN